jgi:hypothetical protein
MNYKDLIACINDTILSGKCLKNYFTWEVGEFKEMMHS